MAKAKVRLAKLADDSPTKKHGKGSKREEQETVARIMKQKNEYESLLKLHQQESKVKARAADNQKLKAERQAQREVKLASIRERRFEEELIN